MYCVKITWSTLCCHHSNFSLQYQVYVQERRRGQENIYFIAIWEAAFRFQIPTAVHPTKSLKCIELPRYRNSECPFIFVLTVIIWSIARSFTSKEKQLAVFWLITSCTYVYYILSLEWVKRNKQVLRQVHSIFFALAVVVALDVRADRASCRRNWNTVR